MDYIINRGGYGIEYLVSGVKMLVESCQSVMTNDAKIVTGNIAIT